jgi:hypothetical protein
MRGRVIRRQGIHVVLGALALALATGAVLPAPYADVTPDERSALLARYLPILYFHPNEDWSPASVERFLRIARVERQAPQGVWTTTVAGIPTSSTGCVLKACYRFNLPCSLKDGDRCYERAAPGLTDWKRGYVYGRVADVPVGTPSPAGIGAAARYLVRYWLFYVFDDWRSRRETLWQAHEADWETVSVGLDATLHPIFAAYSQHCSGSVRSWSKVRRRSTHPLVYVALGSHANYFEKITSPTQFLHCVYRNVSKANLAKARRIVSTVERGITDRTGAAHVLGPTAPAEPLELVELKPPLPPWARFPGRWSEGELLWTGRAPTRFTRVAGGGGPATPKWNSTAIPALWHTESS